MPTKAKLADHREIDGEWFQTMHAAAVRLVGAHASAKLGLARIVAGISHEREAVVVAKDFVTHVRVAEQYGTDLGASAIRTMDAAMAVRGYKPLRKQPWPADVRVRLYKNEDGHGISLAVTHGEVMLPPLEFGLMLVSRMQSAFNNQIN